MFLDIVQIICKMKWLGFSEIAFTLHRRFSWSPWSGYIFDATRSPRRLERSIAPRIEKLSANGQFINQKCQKFSTVGSHVTKLVTIGRTSCFEGID
jgi:hypothetical protein